MIFQALAIVNLGCCAIFIKICGQKVVYSDYSTARL